MKLKFSKKRPRIDDVDEGGNETAPKSADRLEVDSFDRSLVLDKFSDFCAMCKGDHAFGEDLDRNFRMSSSIDDGGAKMT
jgi:hypothetical protein